MLLGEKTKGHLNDKRLYLLKIDSRNLIIFLRLICSEFRTYKGSAHPPGNGFQRAFENRLLVSRNEAQ